MNCEATTRTDVENEVEDESPPFGFFVNRQAPSVALLYHTKTSTADPTNHSGRKSRRHADTQRRSRDNESLHSSFLLNLTRNLASLI